jgi:hypothetical protein
MCAGYGFLSVQFMLSAVALLALSLPKFVIVLAKVIVQFEDRLHSKYKSKYSREQFCFVCVGGGTI